MSDIDAIREAAEVLGFIERWVKRYAKPAGDRHILLAKISTLRALATRPAVDVEGIAEAWDRGYVSGHSRAMRKMSDEPNVEPGVNPYRLAGEER